MANNTFEMLYNRNILFDKSIIYIIIILKGSVSMNAILGARIKSIREAKGFTQEQLGEKMNCSRQKYARLEKGLIDISFASISAIAQILGVKIEEITSAVCNEKVEEPMFRVTSINEQEDKFLFLKDMLDTFYTHRKLYNSVRQVEADE